MRFTEALEIDKIRNKFSDLSEYLYNWEQFNPVCPEENIQKIKILQKEVLDKIDELELKIEELGEINIDSYGY